MKPTTDNLKKILPYLGVFVVLFLGSGLVKIPSDTVWFYGIRYGIIAIVLGLAVYFYSKKDTMSYLLLAIFVPFINDYALHVIFVVLTVILFNKKLLLPFKSPLKPVYILFLIGAVSYIVNQFREFNPLSYPVFIVLFFLPFAFFSLVYKYTNEESKELLLQFYLKLVVIMSAVIILQTIFFWNQHPDARTGGTTHVHYAAVLLVFAFIFVLNKFRFELAGFVKLNIYEKYILIGTLPLLFLMDAKLLFIIAHLILIITLFIYIKKKIYKAALAVIVAALILLMTLSPVFNLPISILSFSYNDNGIYNSVKNFKNSQKFEILKKAVTLPVDEPLTFIIGTGPGTFLSRTSLLKKYFVEGHTYNLYGEKDTVNTSFLASLFPPANTRLEKKYNFASIKGMSTMSSVFDWKSSILSFYFEFGIISILAILYFLYRMFLFMLKSNNKQNYNIPLIALMLLFILGISFINYWFEYSNATIIFNFILANSFSKVI